MKRFFVPALLVLLGAVALGHDGNAAHNRADDLIAKCTETLQDEPDDQRTLSDRGFLYLKQDEYESALVDFEHLVRLDGKKDGYRFSRAYAYFKIADWKAALADLDALCAAGTKVAGAWFTRGELRHELGDEKGALQDLDQAVLVSPKKYPHGFIVRARVRAALGDKKGALEDLNTTIDLDPRNVEALLERAALRARLDDKESWEASKRDLEAALEQLYAADDPRVLATQARILYQRNGMVTEAYSKALAAYDREVKASRSANRKAALLLDAARLRADFGDVWPALTTVEDALQLAPARVDAHELKVRLLERADGAKPETLAAARKALAEVEAAHGVAAVGSR